MSNYEDSVWSDFPKHEQTSFDSPEGQPQLPNEAHEEMRDRVDEAFSDFELTDPGVL